MIFVTMNTSYSLIMNYQDMYTVFFLLEPTLRFHLRNNRIIVLEQWLGLNIKKRV